MGVRKLHNSVCSGNPTVEIRKQIVADRSWGHEKSDAVSILDNMTPLSAQWISEELLLETRKLWSQAYKRVISIDEAIEILMNVKRVAEILVRIHKEGHTL